MRSWTPSKALAACALLLVSRAAPAQSFTFGPAEAEHLLNRAGFGGTPEEIARLVPLGAEAPVDVLSNATALSSDSGLPVFVPADVKQEPAPETMRMMSADERRKMQAEMRRADQAQLFRFRNWWIERMINTR